MSDAEVGKVLLFCLQCDLLDGIEGRILERKGDRDCEKVFPVQLPWKVFAWVVIIAINIAFLAYILQFAATQSAPRQTAWFKSFVLYLALEIAGISTNHVLITHFSLPCLAFVRTQRMKEILCKRIQKHGIDVEKSLLAPLAPPPAGSSAAGAAAGLRAAQEHEGSSSTMTFNAARYLYASYRLSCCFPVSRESQIVRLCSTQVPRQAHFLETEVKAAPVEVVADKAMQDHTWKNIKFLLASAFSSLYRNLLVPVLWAALWLPLSVQDSLLEWITVVLFGYILLLHIRLYEIYPLVAFLPAFVFMVLGHFYVVSGNAEVQVAIAKLKTDAIKARALQRKLHEKRLDIEAAQQAAEESTNGGADGAGGGQAGQDERDISPVHESVKRSSALRVSLSLSGTSTKSGGGSGSSRRNSQPATPAGGAATGTDSSEKFESRLHHFLASADKVLQSQQEHAPVVVATSSAGEGTGGGAGTTVTGGSSPPHAPHERSVPSLRAVDSFYQQKAATTAATTPKATAEPSPNTAMDASSADAAAEKPKRLMKKASFQT